MSTSRRWLVGEVVLWGLVELPVGLASACVEQLADWWRARPWRWS